MKGKDGLREIEPNGVSAYQPTSNFPPGLTSFHDDSAAKGTIATPLGRPESILVDQNQSNISWLFPVLFSQLVVSSQNAGGYTVDGPFS